MLPDRAGITTFIEAPNPTAELRLYVFGRPEEFDHDYDTYVVVEQSKERAFDSYKAYEYFNEWAVLKSILPVNNLRLGDIITS